MKKYKVVMSNRDGVRFTITHEFNSWNNAFMAARHYQKKYELVKEVLIKESRA